MDNKTDNKKLRSILGSIINNNVISDEDALEKVVTKLQLTEYRKIIDIPANKLNATDVYTTLQKYDIIRTTIGPVEHYAIVVSIDIVFNTIWVIPITSDPTIGLTTRIKNSRLFLNSYYFCILYPIPFTGNIRYCEIIDNIAEFKEVLTAVKHYYKDLLKGNNSK
jgi:hypothetical protein